MKTRQLLNIAAALAIALAVIQVSVNTNAAASNQIEAGCIWRNINGT